MPWSCDGSHISPLQGSQPPSPPLGCGLPTQQRFERGPGARRRPRGRAAGGAVGNIGETRRGPLVLDRRGLDALSPSPAASAACTFETAAPHIRSRLVARAYPWLTSGVSQPRWAGPSPALTGPSSAQRAHPSWEIVACSRISDRASAVVAGPCPSSRAAASRRGDPRSSRAGILLACAALLIAQRSRPFLTC
jgi:hypothetical protein